MTYLVRDGCLRLNWAYPREDGHGRQVRYGYLSGRLGTDAEHLVLIRATPHHVCLLSADVGVPI